MTSVPASGKRKRRRAAEDQEEAAAGAGCAGVDAAAGEPAKKGFKGDTYRMISMMDGKSVESALTMKLPDYLAPNLDVIFIGINPGVVSAARGHHYFNPTNHFWRLMLDSGLIDEKMTAKDDARCLEKGFGLTNMVARTSHAAKDLSRTELRDGAKDTISMIQELRPKVACFNGKGIYETFSGNKKCTYGRQAQCIADTDVVVYVMPSTSARTATFPTAADKLRFFVELKQIIDDRKSTTGTAPTATCESSKDPATCESSKDPATRESSKDPGNATGEAAASC